MKNKRCSKYLALCLMTGFLLCGFNDAQCTVTFDVNCEDGTVPDSQSVDSGQKIDLPETPVREGYVFLGWFQDPGLTQPWDAEEDVVSGDMTLYAGWDKDTGDEFSDSDSDKDFSELQSASKQEQSYNYRTFFLPSVDGFSQPYVGDPMPYYEDGVYYIYYLKEAGDSFRHSIYLATTKDFVTYEEYDDPILVSSDVVDAQDAWIGTGSVVKVGDKYYLFYTGHADSSNLEFKETIMLAVGDSPASFEKMEGWEITPPEELGQKNDFRDPQAYYDPETGKITLTVTAAQDGTARILKYTLDENLENPVYDGIIFTDPVGGFWNLECSDTFQIGDTWYLTYSAQDDTLWYAASDTPYGPYGEPVRLDDKLFYAAKHVEDGKNAYMVGWARRSESPSALSVTAWAGNLAVQKLVQREDGTLFLAPVDAVAESFSVRRELAVDDTHVFADADSASYTPAFNCYESFLLTGEFRYTGDGSFGLCFDYDGDQEKSRKISISPAEGKVQLLFNNDKLLITETAAELVPGTDYSFTYIQEGSVGTFYIDGIAALTVRIYGASGKNISLFAENNEVLFSSLRQYTRP